MSSNSSSKNSHAWLNAGAIETALGRESAPETSVIRDILDKSLAMEPLGLDEIVALMRVKKPEDWVLIMGTADLLKQKAYGDRIVLTAPLHIANDCASECLYCSAHKSNDTVKRKRLSPYDVKEAGTKLMRQGHKRIVVSAGQEETFDAEYYAEIIEALHHIFDGIGEIRQVNTNLGALDGADYEVLKSLDTGTVNIFQETYHESCYRRAHPKGPKSDFFKRLKAPDVALKAGMKDVGLGLALGLGPWEYDLLALSLHASHLTQEYGAGNKNVNLHRIRLAPGCNFEVPHPLNNRDFIHCVALVRLAIPYSGIVLSTREPEGLWREGCNAGCSQILTGSLANPYESWINAPGEKIPFPLGEDCHLDEVVRFLLEEAKNLPSFCSACPRLGRSGSEFRQLVCNGGIKDQCGPNSMASFMEFLLNYATPYTRKLGEKLISEKLEKLDEHERRASEKLLQKVRSGRMDEFI